MEERFLSKQVTEQVGFRTSKEVKRKIEKMAEFRKWSTSATVHQILIEYFNKIGMKA